MRWQYPRSPAAARNLLDTGRAHGVEPAACLDGTGLTIAELDAPDTVVSGEQELLIVRNLMAHSGNPPGLGVEAGRRYQLASAGIFGFAMLSSATVRAAVSVGVRFVELSSTFHDFSVTDDGERFVIVLDDADIPADVRSFLLERDVAAITVLAPILFGGALPSGIRLAVRASPGNPVLDGLSHVAEIEFDATRNAVSMPAELLDTPLPAADPHTAADCVRQCEDLLIKRRARSGTSGQVRSLLLRDPARMPPMHAIASRLNVAERTLHRRLAREGTSYRALIDEVREALAAELLATGRTVTEVADRLGYSEPAAFNHAYARWHDTPPSKAKSTGVQ